MTVNVSEVVDNSKLGGFQIRLCALCALCLIMDGFDVQSMGYVAPAIVQDWHIPASALGPVFGAGPLGILVGSLLFSLLADKIGRRPVLIALTRFFSIATILTARANAIHELMLIRFIAGMGLGGDLLSDLSPVDWDWMGFRDRAHRRDCGARDRRAVNRA